VATPAESQEIRALRLSLLLVILFAAGAILIAMYSDSETMSLEAMSAIVDIVVSGLAVFVARKVRAPATHRYQFGYAKYEPLMTTVEGVLMAGVCTGAILYSARDLLNPDPAVCIVLSLVFLKKPFDILRESISDLVDANPYAETINTMEASARAVAERFHLRGVEWVRVRKAGRRVFVMVSFCEDPDESLQGMDQVRQAVIDDVVRLNPDVDVVVAFRPAPAAAEATDPGQSPPAVAAT
jgi:divalent metal cation (Fe/Co/Zn/Cd) transporter